MGVRSAALRPYTAIRIKYEVAEYGEHSLDLTQPGPQPAVPAHREVFVVGARDELHALRELGRRHVAHDLAHLRMHTVGVGCRRQTTKDEAVWHAHASCGCFRQQRLQRADRCRVVTMQMGGRSDAPHLLERDEDPSPDDGRADQDTADGGDPPAPLPERCYHGDDDGGSVAARARKLTAEKPPEDSKILCTEPACG